MLTIRPVVIATLIACSSAIAQTPLAPAPGVARPPQTVGQAVEQAINRNPEVLSRFHNFQASQAEQDAVRGGLRPRIDAQAYAGHETSKISGASSNSYSRPGANLQLRQMIFDGAGVSSDTRRAGFVKLSRYYDLLATSDQIALETVQAYIDVLRYRELELLARDNWGFHQETMQQLERRAQAGVGRRVDLELSLGRVSLSQSNWLTDSANLHDVTQRFQRLVGQPPAERLDPVAEAANLPAAQQVLPDAVRRNPSFLSAVAGIRAARADMDVRRAAKSPTVEFVAQTGSDRSLISTNTPGRTTSSSVQVVLNYNLYRGGADDARARQAQEAFYYAQDARDNACRNIRQTTTIAYNDVRRLREQLAYLEQHQLSTEKAREAYRQQFDIGQRSLLDLLDTENELFQARRAVVNARHDLVLAGYRVVQQSNNLLPAVGQQPLVQSAPPEATEPGFIEDEAALCSTEMTPPQVLDTAAVMAARPPLPATPDLAAAVVPAAKPAAAPAGDAAAVEEVVRAWAAAWSAKNLSTYMTFYSPTFQPLQGGVDEWKSLRSRRVTKAGPINVALENLAVKMTGPGAAEATFTQRYNSADYNEVNYKILKLVREDKGWKIQRETALPPR